MCVYVDVWYMPPHIYILGAQLCEKYVVNSYLLCASQLRRKLFEWLRRNGKCFNVDQIGNSYAVK